uniref:BTB domain-containing protein n=2 Tax=Panagrellus redivivus TaxID=6233 RepID=A0A7E4VZF3_PANRE
MNCTTLEEVDIHSDSMSVLDIDVDKFMTFFKAQRDAIRMFIELTCEINQQEFVEKLNTLFSDKHFKRVNCEALKDKKRIIVLFAGETYPAYIYYVENN